MAVLTIDGKRIEVPEGKSVLASALDAGIYIPHLCHHPSLKPLGSCRMCIVEVEGEEGVATSCDLKVKDGMKIKTVSEEINRLRMLALELLLTGHPEECTSCPKYGNCELQTLIQYIGPRTGRLKMRTKGFKTEERNPLLVHDMNRCVLCGRCVRACNDLRGVKVLQYQKGETETYVGTLHQKLLKDTDCRFCGACAEVCPTGTIRDKMQEKQKVPCRAACPAGIDIPTYVRYVKEGLFDEATAVVREKVPFPKTLGYICTHVCEQECQRKELNDPLSIRNLKRYAAERDTGSCWKGKGKQLPDTGKKVCVIGAGPAGMTAAYYLQKQGHRVTVKEALPEIGGMMRYGIPAYRLDRNIIAEETAVITGAGVKIETNARVERIDDLKREYDAVLAAVGSHAGVRLPIEGNELPGVLLNTEFLRKVNLDEKTGLGRKVVVLGGGNVAFDCARTAIRLGAEEVSVACLESRDMMTADEEEILMAQQEGIRIYPGRTFERIEGQDAVQGVAFMEVSSFHFDEEGRAVIEKEPGSESSIAADTVIFAVGQRPEISAAFGMALGRGNHILAAENSSVSEAKGVFAAGDAVYGTQSVVKAIAAGRKAAQEIDRYLGGGGDISEELAPRQKPEPYIGVCEEFSKWSRQESDMRCEAGRCLQCDLRERIAKPRLWGDCAGQGKEV